MAEPTSLRRRDWPGGRPVPAWSRSTAALVRAIRGFSQAVAAPIDQSAWRERVRRRLAALRARVAEHIVATEGPDGLYAELLEHAPRLTRPVEGLVAEHGELLGRADALARRLHEPHCEPGVVRQDAGELLAGLARHRQRGADLLYEAYATDIGGET
jgi:hypothetical protein